MSETTALGRLVEALQRLPGAGIKTAHRLAFALLAMPEAEALRLAEAIVDMRKRTRHCRVCNHLTEEDLCHICRDPKRDRSLLCVVEEPSNLLAIERTHEYRGLYHVLLGALSPLDGVGPEQLRIQGLLGRLRNGSVQEVILATNPNVKGETTALYLHRLIQPLGVTVTRIAYGVPMGGDLEYADEATLGRAIQGRRPL